MKVMGNPRGGIVCCMICERILKPPAPAEQDDAEKVPLHVHVRNRVAPRTPTCFRVLGF